MEIYLRKEPTNDAMTLEVAATYHAGRLAPNERDVVAYRDAAATDRIARWPWFYTKPDRRNRFVNLNCYRWRAVWLPDA